MKPFGYYLRDDRFSAGRNRYLRWFGKPFTWEKPRILLRELAPEAGDAILDIGCRRGELIAELNARSGAMVVGLDRNDAVLGEGVPQDRRSGHRLFLASGDARQLPFRAEAFTKVTILDCLEHFEDDRGALREIHRVLKPGGTLIITVPTVPGHPPHGVFTRLIRHLPDACLRKARPGGDEKGKTLNYSPACGEGIVLGTATHAEKVKAFGHCRHYTEETMGRLVPSCGFTLQKMYRFQMLFESEMICLHFEVKGFQNPWVYPAMRWISLLDRALPADYPGVGLLARCIKPA